MNVKIQPCGPSCPPKKMNGPQTKKVGNHWSMQMKDQQQDQQPLKSLRSMFLSEYSSVSDFLVYRPFPNKKLLLNRMSFWVPISSIVQSKSLSSRG